LFLQVKGFLAIPEASYAPLGKYGRSIANELQKHYDSDWKSSVLRGAMQEPRLTAPSFSKSGWRRNRETPSLSEVFGSVATRPQGPLWKKLLAFLGPGYLVAVGYMDPGNWATSLAGGSKFGYALLSVALLSNLMAILLQALCARLGIGAGRDLAQACRDGFPRAVSWPLWGIAEIAICATDLAEVIGTAIGLNLLFHIPLEIGVLITALDVFLILWMQRLGFRWVETFVVTLLGVIAACFAVQIALAKPEWREVILGFAPTVDIVRNPDMLYLAIGIIGATVMPHNLYLHSGVVQTRRFGTSDADRREAIKLATLDSTIALTFALLINASILILAAATFHQAGETDVAELGQAHSFLAPLLGSAIAPTLFGIALLCCGMNSTVTATLSGQIVMEGFIDIRLPAWARRLVTRSIAIVPAALVTIWYGEAGSAALLILSQVVLGLALPFSIVPLVMFTAQRAKMGALVAPRWASVLAALVAAILIALNAKLIADQVLG
jgi:manganese transport protein